MYKSGLQQTIGSIALGVISVFSVAQEPISLGSVDVIPTLNLGAAYDDNIRSEETDAQSDTIITITPAIRAQIDNGVSGFSLDYSLTKGEFLTESDESFLNQTYGASFGWNVLDSHVVTISASLLDAHDPRTFDAPSGFDADELDEYEDTTYTFNYEYGDRSVLLAYSLTASLLDKEYQTNREGDNGTRLDDLETDSYDARLDINTSEQMQFSLIYSQSDTRYSDDESVTRDSDQQSYGVGFVWDISEAFDINASYLEVDRDLINDDDSEESNSERYRVSGTWAPYSYSQVTLSLGQAINEPTNTNDDGEDFVEVQSVQFAWDHDWTDVLSTNISYANSESDYVGSTTGRVDDSDSIDVGLDYQLRRWALLNFSVSRTSRDGTDASPKFDKTVAQLGLAFTL